MNRMLKLMRPHQWVKNLFIFIPLFFDHKLTDVRTLIQSLIAFVAFCFVASSVYIINDIVDAPKDRLHPQKKYRPIACGEISKPKALTMVLPLLLAGFGMLFLAANYYELIIIMGGYLLINFAYSFKLKSFAIIDVFIIAIGFVIRILIGGYACNIHLSEWIVLETFLLALFLGFAKRRDDVLIFDTEKIKMRDNISNYNEKFIDNVLILTATIAILSYIMYCLSPAVIERMGSRYLYLTSVFIIAGFIRYLQLTLVYNNSGDPTRILLKDRSLQFIILGWVIAFCIIIYL